jgi:hypothetical protein
VLRMSTTSRDTNSQCFARGSYCRIAAPSTRSLLSPQRPGPLGFADDVGKVLLTQKGIRLRPERILLHEPQESLSY